VKVGTHVVFSECCLFSASAVFDFHYETPSVIAAAVCSILPDADYPKSWLGHQLSSVSEDLIQKCGGVLGSSGAIVAAF
jgi:LexA-binding, inner membrane-associated putative hydrolase